jgi:hypothetical protein
VASVKYSKILCNNMIPVVSSTKGEPDAVPAQRSVSVLLCPGERRRHDESSVVCVAPRATSVPAAHGANVARSRRFWRRAWAVWLGDAAELIVDLATY